MKLLPIIFSIVVLASCGGSKDVASASTESTSRTASATTTEATAAAESENAPPQENIGYGTIRITDSGCKLFIEASQKSQLVKMYPINLEDKYKKDGLRIKFGWDPSRAPQPAGCDASMVVTVKNVTPYRGN